MTEADPLGIATTKQRDRCRFGREHRYHFGFYYPLTEAPGVMRQFITDDRYMACADCGQITFNG